jgi:asparagine synthase (glutamine-hydrolysing)
MCGIAGFTGPHNRTALELRRSVCVVAALTLPAIGKERTFRKRRLAIIDVATDQQPVFNEAGSIAVVFNGEIYNYAELREALQRAPVLHRTFRH